MKIATVILFVLTILYPVGALFAACIGYHLEPVSTVFLSLLIGVLSLYILIRHRGNTCSFKVLPLLMTPLSLINAAMCMIQCPRIWVIAGVLISVGCCFSITVKYAKPLFLKNIVLVLSLVIAVPISFLSYILLIFGNLGQNTAVQTVESPSGTYYAEVIDSDQGALGGDTLVDVHNKERFNGLLFTIEKKPQRVYVGDWGEFETLQLHWQDDRRLVVNGAEYEIEP